MRLPATLSGPTARLVLLLTLAAALLRLADLGWLSLWTDEYVFSDRALSVLNGGRLFTQDNSGVLLAILLLPVYALFGANEWTARLPVALTGIALVPVAFLMGRRLFSRQTGLLLAALVAFSLYLTFWSRVSRHYMPFTLLWMLLAWLLWEMLAVRSETNGTAQWQMRPRPRWQLTAPALVLSLLALLAHQLSYLMVFAIGLPVLAHTVSAWRAKNLWPGGWHYALLSGLWLSAVLLLFSPLGNQLATALLEGVIPATDVKRMLPDWTFIRRETFSVRVLDSFLLYARVGWADFSVLVVPGLLGFAVAFWHGRAAGWLLLGLFWVPFLLLSFVFRSPALPRYIAFLYPLFLLSAALGMGWMWARAKEWLASRWPAGLVHLRNPMVSGGAMVAVALLIMPVGDWSRMLFSRSYGNVVSRDLSHWSFSNWRDACRYVAAHRQPADVVMATFDKAAAFYLSDPSVYWFRQLQYSPAARAFLPIPADSARQSPNPNSFEGLLRMVDRYPRGWILADGYFYSAVTDPDVRRFVERYLRYHFHATPEGSVLVFSWDHTEKWPESNVFAQYGRFFREGEDDPIGFSVPAETLEKARAGAVRLALRIELEGIDHGQEASGAVNGQTPMFLPVPPDDGRQNLRLPLRPEWLRPGENQIRFGWHNNGPDPNRGFVIYSARLEIMNLAAVPPAQGAP